jgi:hypothetical protein
LLKLPVVKKWIKVIFLLMGIVLLILMAKNIENPFWASPSYKLVVHNFQKDPDILPYSMRTIWWNNLIIFKSVIERTIDLLWTNNYFYLPLILFLILIKRKKWLILCLVIIGLVLISIESDPNPSKYFLWLIPLVISGLIE